jgi:3-hydroxybutyryl-CoA dehydrogenase
MNNELLNTAPVLVTGDGSLTCSVAVCLLEAGHMVSLYAEDAATTTPALLSLLEGKRDYSLQVLPALDDAMEYPLAIAITREDRSVKQVMIRQLESRLPPESIIAINTESIGLDTLHQEAHHPQRLCGLNWAEPAHTTPFLEVIANAAVDAEIIEQLCRLAEESWNKDPYRVENFGVRSRLISAIAREAFYLVQQGYASVEDIDRACRNDPGYYLPFAGNCRYMDLMGTYAYGIVMKDLNPDLCRDAELPAFFEEIVAQGGQGMENRQGLYSYTPAEAAEWKSLARRFSREIQQIMNKYPFNYK